MEKLEELINLLIERRLITEDQILKAQKKAEANNKSLEDILLKDGLVDIEEYTKIKAEVYDLPYENLLEKKIDAHILNIIPSEVAENYKIICFDKRGSRIKVGIVDPNNFKAIEAVDFLAKGAGLQVEYFLISTQSFKAAFKQYKTLDEELSSALKTREEETEETALNKNKERVDLEKITKSAPVAKIVSVIIRHAIEGGASDIHIEPLPKESRVRYRIDGILHTSLVLPRSVHDAIVARIKVMANLKLDETRIPQDGRIKLVYNEREVDFRVSTLPLVNTEKVVMRILDISKGVIPLEELGFIGNALSVIKDNIKKSDGLLLVTGPTGSGKSTTLFSLLDILNQEGVNISTLEDPVEYQMKGINQSQIRPEIGFTFASGLRSLLRQDPDIIMVGEIRDNETAELAIHAALTGHFVLSTLHTMDAIGAIPRLMDMKVEPFLLSSTLHTVIAQRLARKICSKCKEETKISDEYLNRIKIKINEIEKIAPGYIESLIPDFDINNLKFYHGKGCPQCGNTGYKGRIAIAEVLDINEKLRNFISDNKKNINLNDIISTQPFITMEQDGVIKVLQGLTTMEEILRVTED